VKRDVSRTASLSLAAAACLLAAGCVRVTWRRDTRFAPPPAEAIEAATESGGLAATLAALGAPLWVWEHEGDGVALAYGWRESRSWNLNLSVPVTNNASASFDYTSIDSDMIGIVLFFDSDLRLREVRRGRLRDLTLERRKRRPAPVPE